MLCHDFYKLPGGEDQVYFDEAWLLEKHGHTVVRFEKYNSDIDNMSNLGVARSTLWSSAVKAELDDLIAETKPDVVHFHNTFPLMSPAAYLAVKKHNIPVVQSLHNFRIICPGSTLVRDGKVCSKCVGKTFALPSILHRCYRESRSASSVVAVRNALHRMRGTWTNDVDLFIALTEHSRKIFSESGLPADKLVVKPNFVRPDPGVMNGRGDYAVFVGRLSHEKGIEVLLNAWKTRGFNIPLEIIGDGPLGKMVETAVDENPHIKWLGQLPFEEVLAKVRNARLLVMPSVWYETFGRAMIEAFAAGVPVVASNIGAMQEIVSDGQNGLHFQVGCSDDLAEKVNTLFVDDELNRTLGNEARREYLTKYTADQNYGLLMKIYEQAQIQS